MASKKSDSTRVLTWSEFCRHHGFKNLGGGRASISAGYFPTIISLEPDGTLTGDGAPDISKAQKGAFADTYDLIIVERFPTMPVPQSAGRPPVKETAEYIFDYRDKNGLLNMVVERFIRPDGEKQCLPWFWYEDDGWKCQDAPRDFKTPLYGNHHGRSRVMIHEGEKAVDAAIRACSHNSTHPWADFLRLFGHCTWKGGAVSGAPRRANWRELDDVKEVYIMPDNDGEGYEAARMVANQLRSDSVYCIHWRSFNEKVPRKWDIADPCPDIPVEVVSKSFSLFETAVYSTYDDDGKIVKKLRDEFAKKFAYFASSSEIVELENPKYYLNEQRFNQSYGHLSEGVKNLARMMYESSHMVRVDRPGYRPEVRIQNEKYVPPERLGRSPSGTEAIVNMYRPPMIAERNPALAEGGTVTALRPFLTYMWKVFPIARERKILLRWICHNMTAPFPEDRALWAVLMVSQTEGTGKSTLGNIIGRLIGSHNVAKVNGAILNDKYTGWLENVQLVQVEELKESSAFRLTEGLKDKITEPTIPIRRMNTDPYSSDNFISLLGSSNHYSALSLARKDRRWFLPKVSEEVYPWNVKQARRYLALPNSEFGGEFFTALWKWINEGGDQYLLWYLRRYGLQLHAQNWGMKNNRAPITQQKEKVIERSASDWQILIDTELSGESYLCLQDVCQWLKESNLRVPRPEVIADHLESIGLIRMFREEGANSEAVQSGRVYLMKKASGGYVVGHVHGKNDAPRDRWSEIKPKVNWLSDRYKGLVASEGAGPRAEGATTDAF